jgi:DNA uptake protein ComE-like DNA-binding protein
MVDINNMSKPFKWLKVGHMKKKNIIIYRLENGACGSIVDLGTVLQAGRSWV